MSAVRERPRGQPKAENRAVACRPGCGACCVAPSIVSPIPGMPEGKPAGVRCIQLDASNRCQLFGRPERPTFCDGLRPDVTMCGSDPSPEQTRTHAMAYLTWLEQATGSR